MPSEGDVFEVEEGKENSEESPEAYGLEAASNECGCGVRSHGEKGRDRADKAKSIMRVSSCTGAEC